MESLVPFIQLCIDDARCMYGEILLTEFYDLFGTSDPYDRLAEEIDECDDE